MKESLNETLTEYYQKRGSTLSREEIASAEANLVGFISLLLEADKKCHCQILKEVKLEEDIEFLLS